MVRAGAGPLTCWGRKGGCFKRLRGRRDGMGLKRRCVFGRTQGSSSNGTTGENIGSF